MSENFRYSVGLNNVGSYQVSVRPYLTSSLAIPASGTVFHIQFESVTKFVTITNTIPASSPTADLRFGFSENGVKGISDNNYAVLSNGESYTGDFKVTSLYLMGDSVAPCSASVVAGLTGIGRSHLLNNWTGSVGVG